MTGERVLPGLGLLGYWTPGSSGWGDQMSTNLRLLSAVTNLSVLSRVTGIPGSAADGTRYIVPSGAGSEPNKIAIRDNGAWVYLAPGIGYPAYVEDEGVFVRWGGASWATYVPLVNIAGAEITGNYPTVDADFQGRALKIVNSGSTVTITVTPGHTSKQPMTVIGHGAGEVVFAPGGGVTISSEGGKLKLNAQYASGTLIPSPLTANLYYLVGSLKA